MQFFLSILFPFLIFPFLGIGQSAQVELVSGLVDSLSAQYHDGGLFGSDELLEITLTGDIRKLLNDRKDDPQYHSLVLSYVNKDSGIVSLDIRAKTRGHFRRDRANCITPPLWMNFRTDGKTQNSLFVNQDKLKLVTACRHDKYVVREYLVYKLYSLITEKSFKARLVQVIYDDNVRGKQSKPTYGILLEDEDHMAKRNLSSLVKQLQMRPVNTNREMFLKMTVFQYLIGNTDWSIQYLHNIKLLVSDSLVRPITVPYDFDHAGIVSAPYAKPPEELKLHSVRDRRYRGYCIQDMNALEPSFTLFNQLKEKIYKLYTQSPYLEDAYVRITTKYLDEFYETINDPKKSAKAFQYPCDPNGTGHIVIKGLRK